VGLAERGTAYAKDPAWPPKPVAPSRRRNAPERTIDRMETTLPQGRALRIQDGQHVELKVVAGCLGVTQDQDREDKLIDAGETFRVTRNGLTLAYACKDVRRQIASFAQAGMPPSRSAAATAISAPASGAAWSGHGSATSVRGSRRGRSDAKGRRRARSGA